MADLTHRMKDCLTRAVQERAMKVRGKKMNPHHLGIVLRCSFKMGASGFDRSTLWRALQIATEAESSDERG